MRGLCITRSCECESDLFESQSAVHVDGHMTDLITERSIRFIDDHAAAPFFLDVTYNLAHWPFQVPDHPSVAAGRGRSGRRRAAG